MNGKINQWGYISCQQTALLCQPMGWLPRVSLILLSLMDKWQRTSGQSPFAWVVYVTDFFIEKFIGPQHILGFLLPGFISCWLLESGAWVLKSRGLCKVACKHGAGMWGVVGLNCRASCSLPGSFLLVWHTAWALFYEFSHGLFCWVVTTGALWHRAMVPTFLSYWKIFICLSM